MSDHRDDLDAYASLAVELSDPDEDRDALLAGHGLDEDGWQVLEEHWTAKLEADERAFGDADGVPPLLAAYGEAFSRAQARRAGDIIPFERYAQITRELARGREVPAVLKRHSVSLSTYLHSHHHWTIKLANDGELARRLSKLL